MHIVKFITNKPLYSLSLPITDYICINQARTTVFREGIKINNLKNVSNFDLINLIGLLEQKI